MPLVRRLLTHRHLAVLLCAATLLLKLVVPTGYMIARDQGRVAVTLCPGTVPPVVAMPGMHGAMPDHGGAKDHGKAEQPCAFAGLSAAALGAVDPVQLAALIAFVIATGMAGLLLPAPLAAPRLRPPPHGPPAYV